MHTRTAEQIRGWSSQPFSGGYGGLHELAAAGFSGAVSADGAWLFMLNGHAIGVAEGPVETFDGASGTAYSAPDDALPLLFAMLERGGEKRGQYYTERTALSEVDKTLSQGGFTGYVELSENVLSGDYYVVYYGGTPMHAAFVGQSERLLTGEEAEGRATDEVGLYDVVAVDLSIIDLPDPPEPTGTDTAVVGGDATPSASETAESTGTSDADAANGTANERPVDEQTTGASETAEAADRSATRPESAESTGATAGDDLDLEATLTGDTGETTDDESDASPSPEADTPLDDTATPERPEEAPDADESTDDPTAWPEDPTRTSEEDSTDEAVAASLGDVELDDTESEADGEPEVAAETGTPAPPADPDDDLTPAVDDTSEGDETPDDHSAAIPSQPTGFDTSPDPETDETSSGPESTTTATSATEPQSSSDSTPEDPTDDTSAEDASELDDLFAEGEGESLDDGFAGASGGAAGSAVDDERVAELESKLESLESERRRLDEEREELADERDRLEDRVAELETEVAAGKPPADFEQVDPETALQATDLFVRYQSKSAETLDDAHGGADNRDAVRGNLDLEHHTRFDAARTAVGDEEYEQFLPTTLEHELVTWLVGDLLYEIRDTGHVEGLRPLYDALPRIDRADLYGEVEVLGGEDTVAFDVVCRDRLGNPLLCVDIHDSRDPAAGEEMESVLEKSGRVGEEHDDFACAFLVTSSFFEPSALELATERTASGGLFGGGKREGFVKLSRKRGYHLCLVEARDRRFHVTLPEL